jgi:aryl-alcohol dehydrogenase-like predicted oxidoreductase
MQLVPLGKTEAQVSELCLGCMYFGTKIDEATAFQLLDQYVDAGGNFLDTANCYAFWIDGGTGDESETVIGRWMKSRHNRDRMFLATKVGFRPAFPGGEFPKDAQGLSATVILQEVDRSLQRLGTDYIDLYYTHLDDRTTPIEETLDTLNQLVVAGKVKHIGCSNITTWRIERAKQISRRYQWVEYCCVQQKYTYLRPNWGADFAGQVFASEELLDYCAANPDLSLLAYSPLLLGAYVRSDRPLPDAFKTADMEARLATLEAIAHDVGATVNQLILAWMLQNTPPMIPLIAASTSEQLQESLEASHVVLRPEQIHALNTAPNHAPVNRSPD